VTTSKVNYPTAPKVEQGAAAFICPYCCMTLPRIEAEERRWV
jgi:hypothetical protein